MHFERKVKKIGLCLVASLVIISCSSPICFASAPSNGVSLILKAKEVMVGFEDGSMRWEENLTRAQAVKIIVTAMGLQEQVKQSQSLLTLFPDVEKPHWAFGVINLAAELGLVKGFPDGTFKPDKSVTKAEYACMLSRMYKALGGIPEESTKIPSITPSWAMDEISQSSDLISALNPKEGDTYDYAITRGETASLTYSLMEAFGLLYDIIGTLDEVKTGSISIIPYNSKDPIDIKTGTTTKCVAEDKEIPISGDLVGKEVYVILDKYRACALLVTK